MLKIQQRPTASSERAKRSINLLALTFTISGIAHVLMVFFLSPTLPPSTPIPNRPLLVSIATIAASPPPMALPSKAEDTISVPRLPHPSQTSTPSLPSNSGSVFAEKYYEVHELNTAPKPLARITPLFPQEALESGLAGAVRLEMFIDEKGEVESLRVLDSTAPGIFDQAAIDAFEHQKFKPGIKDNAPVKAHLKLVIKFGENLNSDQQQ